MVKCPWCNDWEGIPAQYSDHLQYCKKYPPNIELMKQEAHVPKSYALLPAVMTLERRELIRRLHEAVSKLPSFHIESSEIEKMPAAELREVVEEIEKQATPINRSDIEADIATITKFIEDEESDIRKYNDAATYMKNPESKALATHIAFGEMEHATKWKDLKIKLQSELER